MKKTAAFFLILVISFTAVACAQRKPDYYAGGYGSTDDLQKPADSSSVVDTLVDPENTTPIYTEDPSGSEEPPVSTDPPTPTPDFYGESFRILCMEQFSYEVFGDEMSGKELDAAVWERNCKVEDALNVVIEHEVLSSNGTEFYNAVVSSVLAADKRCEIALPDVRTAGDLLIAGALSSWDDYKMIDSSDLFYTSEMNGCLSFAGKQYLLYTDMNLSSIGSTYVMAMNKVLGNELGLAETVIGLVDRGNFTLDAFVNVLAEVDNGKASGISASFRELSCMISGFGASFVDYCMFDDLENWGSGYLFSNYYEHHFDKVEKGVTFLMKIGADDGNSVSETNNGDFGNGKALFSVMTLDVADRIDDTSDFAVVYLPLPKLNDTQNTYTTQSSGNNTVTVRDRTVSDTYFVSCVTAHLSKASQKINEMKLDWLRNNKNNDFLTEILKSRRSDLSTFFKLREMYFFKPAEQYIANGNYSTVTYSDICSAYIDPLKQQLEHIVSNYSSNVPEE